MSEATSQLISSCEETFRSCIDLLKRKNHDYAGIEDEYRNFATCQRIGVSVQTGIMIRLLDKITRLENLLTKEAFVTEESFEDTINDAVNYLAILKARRQFEAGRSLDPQEIKRAAI